MPIRKAKSLWKGKLKDGNGSYELDSGTCKGNVTFPSRFEQGQGSNPEELIGAAHSMCFSMAFSLMLEKAGYEPVSINTTAEVNIDKEGEGFAIKNIKLNTIADIKGISEGDFQKIANQAKDGCPVSKALTGVNIDLDAKLK
jgi:osmotically inducible protein OsmC